MKVVRTAIGNTEVLIRVLDETHLEEIGNDMSFDGSLRNTSKTGITEELKNAFETAKDVIFEIVDACECELKKRDKKPSELSLDFSMSLSAKGNIWVVGCEGTTALKVSLKWSVK